MANEIENSKELNDEQLEKVAGGKYSSWTYEKLGIGVFEPQKKWYHPLITTGINWCSLSGNRYCPDCGEWAGYGATMYCEKRSLEYDPVK